jgi:S-adenosylmethionine/arginine decarboxylase-like enzyme
MTNYGKELILDIHGCDKLPFPRQDLNQFMKDLCKEIDMERGTIHFWDYDGYPEEYEEAPPHIKGASVVQFILTSNITIHTLDDMKRVYLNIFSCKDFNGDDAERFCLNRFGGKTVHKAEIDRI